ncbi:MAG: hypothetical protein K6F05_00790 [Succinivibrio sp.]|nr:hypothetical protein [Succinivibrio sp.]
MEISGGTIANTIKNVMGNLGNQAKEIQAKMQDLSQRKGEDQQMALLKINFEIGQYNAMMQSVASLSSSLTESMKSIANKA